jgi:hypothetical protein
MALKNNAVVTLDGFEGSLISPDAYWKIKKLIGGKNGMHIEIDCLVKDKLHKQETFYFIPVLDGENFIKQAYKYLKSLPEFANAMDC